MYSILIVEDDAPQRTNLKVMLQKLEFNFKIYEASSEREALSVLDKYNIDLFFMDIELYKSSGLDLALKIRNNPKYEFSWIIF
ncbi:putative response regulator [Clostridium botulinum C str. Eklund]|nr:putative response regulator [Clostridium botulinum C str. Eklund]